MLSKSLQEISSEAGEICNFYAGKTIFITGAGGFLGTVLLEILLRCCPDISRIYILLRSKKGIQAEERKTLIFKKEIFFKLRTTNPDVFEKVIALPGDTSQDNLGLNENEYNNLIKDVSVVFHIAATISFTRPLSFTVRQNVIATSNVLDLCRKLANLEALVYTSSVYSSCNQKDVIEEMVYDLPFSTEEIIKFGRDNNEDELMRLYHKCSPPFPNFYTFSKCVSENILKEKAHDLPVCIIRPSLIGIVLKEPLPGYIEEGTVIVSLAIGVGKGFIRVIHADTNKGFDLIPVDVTANAHIVGAFQQASKNLTSPSVYNCVATGLAYGTIGEVVEHLLSMNKEKPLPHSYVCPMVIFCKNPLMYNFLSLLLHYIPGAIIDFFLWISGNKLRLLKIYKFYDKSMDLIQYFARKDWNMRNTNFQSLSKTLSAGEEEIFSMDLKDFKPDVVSSIPTGCPIYRYNGKPYEEKAQWRYLRYFLSLSIVLFVLGSITSPLYLVFSQVF